MARLAVINNAVKTLAESISRAQAAEKLGLESVWMTQLPDARDTSLVLAAYAAGTQRVTLGTGVLPIYTRHPTAMVQMAATLDEISGGSFILGFGISHKVTVEGMWGLHLENPVAAMREYLTIVRTSLRDGGCDFEGKYFSARWMYSGPRRAGVPVMISALNPRMLELAGEMADGVVLWMCSPAYIRDHVVPAVRAGREKAGKTLDRFRGRRGGPDLPDLGPPRCPGHLSPDGEPVREPAFLPQGAGRQRLQGRARGGRSQRRHDGRARGHRRRRAGARLRSRDTVMRASLCPVSWPFGGHQGAAGFEATMEAAVSS